MKKSSLLLFVLISLLAMIIYSSVSVRPAVAAQPDPCWGNGKCSGSSCTTIDVILGIKETCEWNDSQGVQWSQTCSIHLTKGVGSTEVTLTGCDKPSKTGTPYAPPPQSNLTSPVNDTGNTTLPLAIFKHPKQPQAETNNSAINNTNTLPTLTINKEKNNVGNATNLSNDTSILKSSHKSGGHHHNNNKESKTNASTNSSESEKNSQLPEVS